MLKIFPIRNIYHCFHWNMYVKAKLCTRVFVFIYASYIIFLFSRGRGQFPPDVDIKYSSRSCRQLSEYSMSQWSITLGLVGDVLGGLVGRGGDNQLISPMSQTPAPGAGRRYHLVPKRPFSLWIPNFILLRSGPTSLNFSVPFLFILVAFVSRDYKYIQHIMSVV